MEFKNGNDGNVWINCFPTSSEKKNPHTKKSHKLFANNNLFQDIEETLLINAIEPGVLQTHSSAV